MTKQQIAKMSKQDREFQILYNNARISGIMAGTSAKVVPMIVSEHTNMLDDRSPVKQSWFVEGGCCGFAWITIRPANCAFANWVKKNGLGKTSEYAGGVRIWVHEFGQSMARKEEYAGAFAGVLSAAGINAYSESRMD